ncbi:hypothetical protein K450DRAFT_270474 [Umbelopsis ramanniana AG]|uniref:FAD-binding domain-containing protein n=1 Tax=Umbelopsis ramanniana AG TaxID=1314678 RepID=A0AAD5ECP3_UMBRA|nr:uncharacterized protein K450DRAFT_270474 [Umbelopsis ramanniana AG]KAI8580987.1 hypothetical protein K450DRAFT_270474 [Umbelopsis ramanniana AG]
MEQTKKFKAIIVGGSISGLTLALCFEKANIDYIVLEAREKFAPQVGASVGLFPNGLRILDQLGITETIERSTEPLKKGYLRSSDGKTFCRTKIFEQLHERHGYTFIFLERQQLLSFLYEAVTDKSKLLANKKVDKIAEDQHGVKVTITDGSVYEGDIVIGTDGVWSSVREHMWKEMEKDEKLAAVLEEDRQALFCEYSCLFGISDKVQGIHEGRTNVIYRSGTSFLSAVGKGGTIYWFFFEKLPEVYKAPNIPRFSEQDAIDSAEKQADSLFTEDIKFAEIWKQRRHAVKVAMEEGVIKRWHYGRTVLLGDAAHKYTANFGMGANSCIESAVVFTNTLYDSLKEKPDGLDHNDIEQIFTTYQSKRQAHVEGVCTASSETTRMEALDGFKRAIMGKYVFPLLGDGVKLNMVKALMLPSPTLSFLDKPTRPHTIPYLDEEQPKGWFSWLGF